jgi:hypothetical protein
MGINRKDAGGGKVIKILIGITLVTVEFLVRIEMIRFHAADNVILAAKKSGAQKQDVDFIVRKPLIKMNGI